MSKPRVRRAGSATGSSRRQRPRPMPKWLEKTEQLDAIARSRCLMVLSVLSGERPVTQAITQAKISRGTYYQLETRALKAMLAALNPAACASKAPIPDLSAHRIEALLERIRSLEQDKRRSQRLLMLTRKSMRAAVTTGGRGRLPASAWRSSTKRGKPRWVISSEKAKSLADSIPTRTGESAP